MRLRGGASPPSDAGCQDEKTWKASEAPLKVAALGANAAMVQGAQDVTGPLGALAEGAPLEEIRVTARRRDESLQEVPMAVTAFTSESLTLQGAQDITELAQSVPSLTLEPTRATNTTLTAFIRGVGQQDPLAGFEQGVALYIDDVYIARPQGALLDIYDVERIEVLRGPQGTLYGRNAVGGAVKYVTARLSDEPELSLKTSLGSWFQTDLIGKASMPISSNFRVGATLASFDRDGFGQSLTTGEDQYNKDILAYRFSAEYEPAADWLLRLSYDNTEDQSAPVAGHRPYPGVTNGESVLGNVYNTYAAAASQPSTAGIGGDNEVNSEGINFTVDWEIADNLTARSISSYREDDTVTVIDFDGLAVNDFDTPTIYENEQTSQELQLLWNTANLNGVVGLYYLDAEALHSFDVVLGQLAGGLTAYTGGMVDTEAWSIYGDATYDFYGDWSISVGGRYTEDKRSADVLRATYGGIGSPFMGNDAAALLATTSDYEASKTFDNFSPRINLRYNLNNEAQVYAGYSQGWKAGSFDPRGLSTQLAAVEEGFDEETLDSYEVGIKADWLDGRLRTNLALFYSEYEDMQIPGSIGVDTDDDGINDDFVGTVTNAGEAEISGLELEGYFTLTSNLSGQFALSLLDAEIKEWLFEGVDISADREIQNTPEFMSYLGLNYALNLPLGALNINGNWSFKDDITQFETPNADIDQEAYHMFNASVVWTSPDEKWRVGLHGKNLGDEKVRTAGYCFGPGCPGPLGLEDNTTVFYGPPRTFTVAIEYSY